jgi:hypothetical protein
MDVMGFMWFAVITGVESTRRKPWKHEREDPREISGTVKTMRSRLFDRVCP